jgi:hypothetical protein
LYRDADRSFLRRWMRFDDGFRVEQCGLARYESAVAGLIW